MEYKTLLFNFVNGGHVKILFKKYSAASPWMCEMSDEFMEDLEDALEHQLEFDE